MVAIQIILVVAFLLFLYKFLNNPLGYKTRAWAKILTVLFTIIAIIAIVFPNSSNTVARWVGVAKGADLLLYILTLSFIFTLLNLYIKDKQYQKNMSVLARRIALIETKLKQKNKK